MNPDDMNTVNEDGTAYNGRSSALGAAIIFAILVVIAVISAVL